MIGLETKFDNPGNIKKMYEALQNRRDLNIALVEDIRAGVMENFKSQSNDGEKWVGLALSTLKRRRKIGRPFPAYPILVNNPKTGLKGSVMTEADNNGGKIYTNKVYAAAQHFGYEKRNLPARPFMTITQKAAADCRDTIKYFYKKWLSESRK